MTNITENEALVVYDDDGGFTVEELLEWLISIV
jgi:hypothetical protein